MAYTRGRCINVDYCSLAAARRDIEVKIGDDFVCPECAKPLRAPPVGEGSRGPTLAVVGGAAVLVLVAGGLYAGYRLASAPRQPATAAMAPQTVPKPAAQQPQQMAAAPAPALTPAPAAAPAPAKPEQAVLLRLEGAPSMAGLAAKLAAAYLANLGDSGIAAQPGNAPGQTLVTGQRLGRPEAIAIVASTPESGFTALGGGTADISMSARRVRQTELDRLRALGDLSAPSSEHAIGFDGGAVVVNPRNTVPSMTLTQLRRVLDGSITAWSQLGGSGGAIRLVAAADRTADGFRALVPGAPAIPANAPRVADAASAVLADADAMSLVPLSATGQARVVPIAAIGAAPAAPGAAAIAGGAYPLTARLYLYTAANSANPFAARFAAFAQSAEGQSAVAQAGLVPLHVAAAAAAAPLTPKDRYRALVANATRLAADLHFEPNSNKLDLHSSREVDRVWNFMMSDHTPPDHLVLMGFADNQGTADANLAISKQRAEAVAAVFAKRGLPPGQVVAFGADLPLADNASEAGRDKNRRVEVFLRK